MKRRRALAGVLTTSPGTWRSSLAVVAPLLLLVCGVLGGGQGGLGDLLAQELALLLLALMAWGLWRGHLRWDGPKWVLALPALAIVLPLLQLLPVPPSLWALGDARSALLAQLQVAGVSPTHRLSLDPAATEYALYSLLPATALFLATLFMPARGRTLLMLVLVVLAVANVLLGMAQLEGGTASPLRFYRPTNADQAVGLFANRNHMAGFLAMVLPLVQVGTGRAVVERIGGRTVSPLLVVAGCALVVLVVVGIALTGSRAGVLLGAIAVLGSLPLALSGQGKRSGAKRVLVVALAFAIMLAMQYSLLGALHRMAAPTLEDGRLRYAVNTIQAAREYLPLGSGLGTFREVYPPFESAPGRYIVNHAHNDYAELLLEGGVPALVLIAVAWLAWTRQGLALWRDRKRDDEYGDREALLVRTTWFAASLALLHSFADFPLRTTAGMAAFAVLAAIAFSEPRLRRARVPSASPDA
jgi:O-antigen ligase